MLRASIDRLLQSILVIFILSFLIYGMIGLMPGDPIDAMVASDPNLSQADGERMKERLGLNQPLLQRYYAWLSQAVTGDLGYSRLYSQPVLETVGPRLKATGILLGASLILSLAIAIPIGVIAAARPHSFLDYGVNLFCFAGVSAPPFWLALLAIILFAVTWGILPASGQAPEGAGILTILKHTVLPVGTLTLASVGGFIRYMRGAMLETMRRDYIRTARAKGAGKTRVLIAHALRNALLPLVTIVALSFGTLFSGALITETMFSWPGMGKTIYDAILGNDYNLALVGLLLASIMTIAGNVLADLLYALLDPRVDYKGQEGRSGNTSGNNGAAGGL